MTTKPKTSPPKPPTGMSTEAMGIWKRLHAEYELGDTGAVQILTAALKAFETMRQAEALIAKEGVCTSDRYGTPKAHPAVDIAKNARAQWLNALRMLGLHREAV